VRDTNRGAEALLAIGGWSPCLQLMGGSHAPRPGTHTLRPGTHTLNIGSLTKKKGARALQHTPHTIPHNSEITFVPENRKGLLEISYAKSPKS
jgi:hypothetical protein